MRSKTKLKIVNVLAQCPLSVFSIPTSVVGILLSENRKIANFLMSLDVTDNLYLEKSEGVQV